MGPHTGLSLRGGTGYTAPHWNLELGTIETGLTSARHASLKSSMVTPNQKYGAGMSAGRGQGDVSFAARPAFFLR